MSFGNSLISQLFSFLPANLVQCPQEIRICSLDDFVFIRCSDTIEKGYNHA